MSEIIEQEKMNLSTRTEADIAIEINEIKQRAEDMLLDAAVEVGKRLTEARRLVPQGRWLEWLRYSVNYSERDAEVMMQLAQEYQEPAKLEVVRGLGKTKALALLRVQAEERQAFVIEHDVENLSTRELNATIRRMEEEKKRLQEEKHGLQLQLDELLLETRQETMPVEDAGIEQELRATEQALEQARLEAKKAKEAAERDVANAKAMADKHKQDKQKAENKAAEAERQAAMAKEQAARERQRADEYKRIAEQAQREAQAAEAPQAAAETTKPEGKTDQGEAVKTLYIRELMAFQEAANNMLDLMYRMDDETAAKMRGKTVEVLGALQNALK